MRLSSEYLLLIAFFLVSLLPDFVSAEPPPGRLAIVVDGNFRDSDDIAATPVTLAMLIVQGHADRLVHYSHSCDLRKGPKDAEGVGPNGMTRQQAMQDNCDVTVAKWGQFPNVAKFFDCIAERRAAVDDLTAQIEASSDDDPLWFILAGEPDILYLALTAASPASRAYVHVITHHKANHRGDEYDFRGDFTSAPPQTPDRWVVNIPGFDEKNIHLISDQNQGLKQPLEAWDWARTHDDPRIAWLYDRIELAQRSDERGRNIWQYDAIRGKADVSDAGMVWYWTSRLTDEKCQIEDLRSLFVRYITRGPSSTD